MASLRVFGSRVASHLKSFNRGFSSTDFLRYGRRKCECLDLYKELIPYADAWSWQKSIVEKRRSALMKNGDSDDSDTLIVLQHHPVYTLGKNCPETKYLKFDIKDSPYDIYRVERGGKITYHGPGQIVLYPIINLSYHQKDLPWYIRSLEEVVIRVLSNAFSIKASRYERLHGIWIGNQKIAAVGISHNNWITYHGLALNITTDLSPFQHIVPCGIRDREVTSLSKLLSVSSDGSSTDDYASQLMDIAHDSLLKEFSEVFQLEIEFTSKFKTLGEQPSNS